MIRTYLETHAILNYGLIYFLCYIFQSFFLNFLSHHLKFKQQNH
jgi:hypothetical protein